MILVGLAFIHASFAAHSEALIAVGMTLAILGMPLTYLAETMASGPLSVQFQCMLMALVAPCQIAFWLLMIDIATKVKEKKKDLKSNH